MKKKVISILLSTAMTAVLLAGCGDAAQETAAPETAEEAPAAEEEESTAGTEEEAPRQQRAEAVHMPLSQRQQVIRIMRRRRKVLHRLSKRWEARRSYSIRRRQLRMHRYRLSSL